ncbi:MAG: hypothetical protein HYV65_00715 [Candidatus Spechtbacteria bacterium]|nr:hypothetical protein [Candidatus Spechtbacteria bacterium]
MNILTKTSPKGDELVATWNPAKVAEGDPEALAAVAEAERIFEELRTGKNPQKIAYTPFAIDDPVTRNGHQIDKFEPMAGEISMRHPIAGG